MTAAPRRSHLMLVGLVVVGITLLYFTRAALERSLHLRSGWPPEADTLYLPGATALRLASLGHTELAADLVAAQANVYFGAQLSARGQHRWLYRYLATAIDLDPKFHGLYRRGAAMLMYTGRPFSVEAALAANRLLERGAREFPGDWEIFFQLGFNLLFELPPLAGEDDPRVPEWRQRGVEALRQATLLDGVPPWLPNLAAKMLTRQGSEALAIKHLEQTYAITSNPETRVQIRHRLSQLRGRSFTLELERGAKELQELVSSRYPFAPEAFSIVAGPRFEPGVDLSALVGQASQSTGAHP